MSRVVEQTDSWAFCEGILPHVSRSFALIIPKCPPPIDRALCVGYLICRVADTIEDDPSIEGDSSIEVDQRAVLYDALLAAVDEPGSAARQEAFRRAWPAIPAGAYGRLVRGFDAVLAAYRSLPDRIRPPIRHCVHEMVAGMRTVGPVETLNNIAFLCRDTEELERYCHYVAGTVGIMATTLFETRFSPAASRPAPMFTPTAEFTPTDAWREDGRRLGLGLQMTNIIKDCRVDATRNVSAKRGANAARGVSFIPPNCVDLTDSSYRLKPSGRAGLVNRAISHLDAGLRYVLAIRPEETGIRTFLLGSLLPAIATLEVAAPGTEHHPKITRAKMTEIFTRISRHVTDNDALTAWYTEHRRQTLASLA